MSEYVFVTPPGWPQPPAGWTPPDGWRPDSSWPPAPPGWQFWQAPPPAVSPAAPLAPSAVRAPASAVVAAPPPAPVAPSPAPPLTPAPAAPGISSAGGDADRPHHAERSGGGIFGRRRKELQGEVEGLEHALAGAAAQNGRLERDNAALRAECERLTGAGESANAELRRLLGLDPAQVRADADRMAADRAAAQRQLNDVLDELARARKQLVVVEESAMLQEAGVYEYLHPLEDAVASKARLTTIKEQIKELTRDGAVRATTGWNVNGSAREGAAMVRDFSKLMLRAYNAEADNCVRTVRPHRLAAVTERLSKVRDTIARLGRTMDISISPEYHRVRLAEIRLTADYLGKVEEEKERVRAQRERQREEERAQREFEREKARLFKEQAHYQAVLTRVRTQGDAAAAAELESRLGQIADAISGVEAREANIRAGYVYVISNLGAFGPGMVKIGMTRRLEPSDRIRELGDASVPFRFDTHALIFSEDAVGLEARLHQELAERKVNLVNQQREFFYASPAQVRDVLARVAGQHLLEYHEEPEALEWYQSRRERA